MAAHVVPTEREVLVDDAVDEVVEVSLNEDPKVGAGLGRGVESNGVGDGGAEIKGGDGGSERGIVDEESTAGASRATDLIASSSKKDKNDPPKAVKGERVRVSSGGLGV